MTAHGRQGVKNMTTPRPRSFRPNRAAKALGLLALAVCLAVFLAACAKKEKETDPFLDEWKKKAEESQNQTYTPVKRKVEFSQLAVTPDNKPVDAKPARSLPSMRVSLNFYNTDLQAVLRSMARIAGQNIVLSAALQSPDTQGKFKVSVNVNEIPWDQAFNSILNANGLSYDWDGEIIRVMALEDLRQQNAMKKALEEKITQQEKLKIAEPMVTAKVQVNYADVTELEKTLKGYLSDNKSPAAAQPGQPAQAAVAAHQGAEESVGKVKGTVVADRHSNSIIIQATREHAELLVKLVERLDEPRLQIHLKAYIVEASRQALTDIGMQWGGAFRSGKDAAGNRLWVVPGGDSTVDSTTNRVRDPVYGVTTPAYGSGASGRGYAVSFPAALTGSTSSIGGQGMALNFLYGSLAGNILQAQLTALASEGKINIVSEPSITTLDNTMAFTENGQRVPYVTTSQNGTNVQFQDAVLRLEMTPHVIDGQNLRMRLVIKNDEVVADKTQWVQGNPPMNKKLTETTLIIEDGQTIIISGLAKHNLTTGNQGVPPAQRHPGGGVSVQRDFRLQEQARHSGVYHPHHSQKQQPGPGGSPPVRAVCGPAPPRRGQTPYPPGPAPGRSCAGTTLLT